jgi:hypothetical protein
LEEGENMGGEFESVEDLENHIKNIQIELKNPKEILNSYMGSHFLPFTFIKERLVYKEMEGLVEGRIVHFVLDNHVFKTNPDEAGNQQSIEGLICRPAIIVNALGGKSEDGMVNLQIFLDGTNDSRFVAEKINNINTNIFFDLSPNSNLVLNAWATSVKYSETKETGTWHWPERS